MHCTLYVHGLISKPLQTKRCLIDFCLIVLPDYGVDKYDIGAGFGHFGIAVEDVSSIP